MPKIANTHSLSDYPKLSINQYKGRLNNAYSMQTHYSYRGKDYNYSIRLDKTPCNYGGYRYWFICPNCNKRVGVLYCAGLYVCRHCIGASYQTQLNQPLDNVRRKMHKLANKLNWVTGKYGEQIPLPKKGMHLATFIKLDSQYKELKKKENLLCMASFMAFCDRRGLEY